MDKKKGPGQPAKEGGKLTTFRLSGEARAQLNGLAMAAGLTKTAVLESLIRQAAHKRFIENNK